jgi:hypothetical protein
LKTREVDCQKAVGPTRNKGAYALPTLFVP